MPDDVDDAERWRFIKPLLKVARIEEHSWTSWLELPCIPLRTQTTDVDVFIDVMRSHFPHASTRTQQQR
jgi:hypothetical protein